MAERTDLGKMKKVWAFMADNDGLDMTEEGFLVADPSYPPEVREYVEWFNEDLALSRREQMTIDSVVPGGRRNGDR